MLIHHNWIPFSKSPPCFRFYLCYYLTYLQTVQLLNLACSPILSNEPWLTIYTKILPSTVSKISIPWGVNLKPAGRFIKVSSFNFEFSPFKSKEYILPIFGFLRVQAFNLKSDFFSYERSSFSCITGHIRPDEISAIFDEVIAISSAPWPWSCSGK